MNKNKPKIYTLSAIILGYAMLGDYNANEQNAIGNWFMLIGQILETNSAMLQQFSTTNNNDNDIDIDKIKEVLNNLLERIERL